MHGSLHIFIAQENRSEVPAQQLLTMPSFVENNEPSSSAKRGRVDHQQASSEMEDATNHNSGASITLASRPSRQNDMASQGNISAPTTDTDDQAHCTGIDVSTTYEKEGSTFYLLLNDVDDDTTDHFQRDSEATSSRTSMADPLPKRFCRRRRKQRRYPKERHIVLVARDLLAQIDNIDE